MTRRETISIIRESSLWKSLSVREKVEAIAYALDSMGYSLDGDGDDGDISDVIGEIYSG
ncbi:MAG: hypothetical protein Kow0025_08530 [Thermodesulfovibrionales bacterium]